MAKGSLIISLINCTLHPSRTTRLSVESQIKRQPYKTLSVQVKAAPNPSKIAFFFKAGLSLRDGCPHCNAMMRVGLQSQTAEE